MWLELLATDYVSHLLLLFRMGPSSSDSISVRFPLQRKLVNWEN